MHVIKDMHPKSLSNVRRIGEEFVGLWSLRIKGCSLGNLWNSKLKNVVSVII